MRFNSRREVLHPGYIWPECQKLLFFWKNASWFKDRFRVVSHFVSGFYIPGALYDNLLFLFGEFGKSVQGVGMHSQFHGKADGELFIIDHPRHLRGRPCGAEWILAAVP